MILRDDGTLPVDLETVRCFEAVATRLSFRKAAQAVALSPAALTTRIRRLEEELGTPLFARTTRRVDLTPAGLRLLPHARELLALAGRTKDVARGGAAPAPFQLRIGTRFELGLSWLVPALPRLERARPQRSFQLAFGTGPELMRDLGLGRLDAVITSARLSDPRIEHVRLHEERYLMVGSPRLLRRTPLKSVRDAQGHVLLDTNEELPLFRYFLDACPPDERWRFARVELLGVTAAIRLRLLQGHGVAVLPRHLVAADLRRKALVAAGPPRKLPTDWFRLVWRLGHPLAERLHELGRELADIPLH